jgi:hypothetical protein
VFKHDDGDDDSYPRLAPCDDIFTPSRHLSRASTYTIPELPDEAP